MSSVHTPRSLGQPNRTSMDMDREKFEKVQLVSCQKAINAQETPLKEKHARRVIIGTHQVHSSNLFWSVILHFQLQGNPIVCWKFCQVLHKVLRDGHAKSLAESHRYCGFLLDLGKLWGHLREGYGRLIAFYTKLLVQKLNFHKKYPEIPGSLTLDDPMIDKLCNNDINTYFEVCVDMLDYMDDIISFQQAVFGSLDMSRANSMTSVGQCRLAPLIPCIQDSCQLYDSTVKVLFKLHASLPPDTLTGHRDRFYQQYKNVKRFYFNSGNLQYFKNLIRVPQLPDEPPNFLVASDLSSHVRPVVVIQEPEPEPEPEPEMEVLVDTAVQENGEAAPPMPDERDIMIQQLMGEVTRLKMELSEVKAENQMMVESLHNRIREVELELSEYRQIAESTQQENEILRTALKDGEKNQDAAGRLAVMAKIAKTNDDKFKKIREMYNRIKEEHVKLLRNHGEQTKQMSTDKKVKDEVEEERRSLSQQLHELQHEKSNLETSYQQSSAATAEELSAIATARSELQEQKQSLETELEEISADRDQTQTARSELSDKHEQSLQNIQGLEGNVDCLRKKKKVPTATLR